MTEKNKPSVKHRLRTIATIVGLALSAAACTVDSTFSKTKADGCQVLFERAYPEEGERRAWTAGRDIPPADWDAYREADKRSCAWLIVH
jgi:hypothetical protein